MKNTALNINNVTHLWKVAGEAFEGYKENSSYEYSLIKNSEWPNRIWTNKVLTKDAADEIKLEMEKDQRLTFSFFNKGNEKSALLTGDGFTLKSKQYGMSLPLESKFKIEKNIDFVRVNDKVNALLWSSTFFEAFKYRVGVETIIKTSKEVQYFLVYHQQEIVGTIALLITNDVIGIHSLGILPSQRKKGLAKEIMHYVLNNSIEQNHRLATLQASEMAKNIYLKMGFSIDFIMENYTLKNDL